ncbi:MAG: two-component regulator propeller domain-containing protein [Bryobacteraceae bacterium]
MDSSNPHKSSIANSHLICPPRQRGRKRLAAAALGHGFFRTSVLQLINALVNALLLNATAPPREAPAKRSIDALSERTTSFEETIHTAWTRRDGAPGSITALAQTKNGYLWIGSSLGLYRFDGIGFSSYPFSSKSASLPSADVASLAADPNGGLWVGLRAAVVMHLNADGSTAFHGRTSGLTSDTLDRVVARPDGSVWAIAGSKLFLFQNQRWIDFGRDKGLGKGGVFSLFFDREGNIWVGQADRLCILRKGSHTFAEFPVSVRRVSAMAESAQGQIWICDAWRSVRPLQDPSVTGAFPIHGRAELLADSEGNLWIAQDYYRLARIRHFGQSPSPRRNLEVETTTENLSSPEIRAILQDREGNVWIGTARGLDRFEKTSFKHLQTVEVRGYPALLASNDGALWMDAHGSGLIRVKDGAVSRILANVNSAPLIQRGMAPFVSFMLGRTNCSATTTASCGTSKSTGR